MKAKLAAIALLLNVSLSTVFAQNYSVDRFKITSGIGTSTGGPYSVIATVRPAATGGAMTGGSYAWNSDFWSMAILTGLVPPMIAQNPADEDVVEGDLASFNVELVGPPPFTFQWFTDNGSIAGLPISTDGAIVDATNQTFSFITSLNDNGKPIYVIVQNVGGSVTSSVAHVSVSAAIEVIAGNLVPLGTPAIYVNGFISPSNSIIAPNTPPVEIAIQSSFTNATIFFTVDGTDPDLSGELYLDSFLLSDSAIIRAIAYNSSFTRAAECESFYLTLTAPPEIVQQPQDLTVVTGSTATFTLDVIATEPIIYLWHFNGIPFTSTASPVLVLESVSPALAGSYHAIVSNAFGTSVSLPAVLTVLRPPGLTAPPAGATVQPGATVTFSVTATGTDPLLYQWRKNGVNIPGATGPILTLTNIQVADGGTYDVLVGNDAGTVLSDPARLTVEVPVMPPGNNFADRVLLTNNSDTVTGTNFFANKETGEPDHADKPGGASVWYKWIAPAHGIAAFSTSGSSFDTLLAIYTGDSLLNLHEVASDEDRGGFLTSQLTINAQPGVEYQIAIDGFAGAQGEFALSWNFAAQTLQQPVITTQPSPQTVIIGGTAQFTVLATGPDLTYQWHVNHQPLDHATNSALILTNVQPEDVGLYTVLISDSDDLSVESRPVFLEIGPDSTVHSVDKFEDLPNGVPNPVGKLSPRSAPSGAGIIFVSAGIPGAQIINNTDSTTSLGEYNGCVIGGASRWLKIHTLSNATLVVNTKGSSIDTFLVVFTNVLTAVCNDDAYSGVKWSSVTMQAVAGTTYSIQVDGKDGTNGLIYINWGLGSLPTAPDPVTNSVYEGTILVLDADPTGAPAPTLQWFKDGVPLPSETNSTLIISNIQFTAAGTYKVFYSNFIGSVMAKIATVKVNTNYLLMAESGFDKNDEGWRVEGEADSMVCSPGGGNPGGHLSASCSNPNIFWYWTAPTNFLGNKSGAFQGLLSFDFKSSSALRRAAAEDIILTGGGLTLVYDHLEFPAATWATREIAISTSAGWKKGSRNGPAATETEILRVLSSLTGLKIRGKYSTLGETDFLDNVRLRASRTNQVTCLTATRLNANQVQLEWPTTPAGYQVETKVLLDKSFWVPVEDTPSVSGHLNRLSSTVTNTSQYFRLRKP